MNSLTTVNAGVLLEDMASDIAPLLRENGQSFDRLKSVFIIAVQQNPDILKCTPESLRREMSKCAADGVVPDNKEAVLLPYWDKEAKAFIANYQPMVYGIIKRMKELGSVFNIVVETVHKNDTFTFNAADPDSLFHNWDMLSDNPRGEARAAYVIFRDDQKRVMHREIMTLSELQAVRAASKAPNSPAWRNFEGEMYQKAVLRRGSKYISINNDKIRALIERQDDMFDFQATRAVERTNPFTGEVIEGNATPAIGHQQQMPMTQERDKEPAGSRQQHRQQRNDRPDGGKDQNKGDRSSQGKPDGKEQPPKADAKPKDDKPPAFPEVEIFPADRAKALEAVEKLLAIALLPDLDPAGRRGVLKDAAPTWKEATPEAVHPLLLACVQMTDWAIQQQVKGLAWSGEHATFVHKAKTLFEVEKLNIGKYPG